MKANLNRAFAGAIALLFTWALFEAQGFRAQARLFPLVIGVTGLLLVVVYLVSGLRQETSATEPPAADAFGAPEGLAEPAEALPPEVRQRRTAAILAWTVGFALATWLLGFPLAVPLATFAYLKMGARESWVTSVVFAAVTGAVFYGLFVEIVHLPFEDGVLVSLILG